MNLVRHAACLFVVATLAACGGDSSSDAPAPVMPPDRGAGTVSSSSCFNPNLLVSGTAYNAVTRATYPGLGTGTYATSITANGPTSFNGLAALKSTETNTFTPDAGLIALGQQAGTANSFIYVSADSAAASAKSYGDTTMSAPASSPSSVVTVATTNAPYIESRFTLAPMASFTQSYSQTQVTTVVGGAMSTNTSQYVKNVQYLGIVSVTVPAGTFQACQFVETGTMLSMGATTPVSTGTSTIWLGVNNGLPIKNVTQVGAGPASAFELVSASINGVNVVP